MKSIKIENISVPVLVRTLKSVLEELNFVWSGSSFTHDCESLLVCFEISGEPHVITLHFYLNNTFIVEMHEWGQARNKFTTINETLISRGVCVNP